MPALLGISFEAIASAANEAAFAVALTAFVLLVLAPMVWWKTIGRERRDRRRYERETSEDLADTCTAIAETYRMKAERYRASGDEKRAVDCECVAAEQERIAARHRRISQR
jgi:hypothetical protein